jgi:hypothetical protein
MKMNSVERRPKPQTRDGMKRDPKETGVMPGCRTYLGDNQLYIHGIGHVPGARAQGCM